MQSCAQAPTATAKRKHRAYCSSNRCSHSCSERMVTPARKPAQPNRREPASCARVEKRCLTSESRRTAERPLRRSMLQFAGCYPVIRESFSVHPGQWTQSHAAQASSGSKPCVLMQPGVRHELMTAAAQSIGQACCCGDGRGARSSLNQDYALLSARNV